MDESLAIGAVARTADIQRATPASSRGVHLRFDHMAVKSALLRSAQQSSPPQFGRHVLAQYFVDPGEMAVAFGP